VGCQVETAVLVAAVEGRHVPGAGEGHRHIVAEKKNAEKRRHLDSHLRLIVDKLFWKH